MTGDGIDEGTLKALLEAFEKSDWESMSVTIDGDTLQLSRSEPLPAPAATEGAPARDDAHAPAATSTVSESTPPAGVDEVPSDAARSGEREGVAIASPTVGTFWRASSPATPPFVEVGSQIEEGDTIGIVEVMKLMNHVTADVSGTVTDVLVDNGGSVEFGQALVMVVPASG